MAKTVKKKHRRMKKTVRNTLGTLFLISAIIVAAIPVEGLQAAPDIDPKVTVDETNCSIPNISTNETIYTTGDGQYQFAYVSPGASSNKVAVILGCNRSYLQGNALTIPNTLDAYLKYSNNLGTEDGYVAVGESGNFLFYAMEVDKVGSDGKVETIWVDKIDPSTGKPMLDESGEVIREEVIVKETKYYPCYFRDYAKWGHLGLEEFYYNSQTVSGGEPVYLPTTTSQFQRIQGAEVWYIGNQYLEEELDSQGNKNGTWRVKGDITDSSQGIFANWGGIRTLTVGEKLSGIGNYAFYGCSGLDSITLKNGLDTIGNWAFANCVNMTRINLDLYTNVSVIGDHAFYNCQALQNFRVPVSVTALGDSAFEDCWGLQSFEFGGEGANVLLSELGENVFKGCTNLQELSFPRTFNNGGTLDISMFEGCSSLKYISTPNNTLNFVEGVNAGFGFEEFKKMVPEEFYFEGLTDSPLHRTATEQNIAFSHLGIENGSIVKLDLYEITKVEGGKKAVYRVNSHNELVWCDIEEGMETVTMPNTIGPYKILVIESETFQNKCSLKKITIPSSIQQIKENAFKGCHNLKHVIFLEPNNLQSIGQGAFKTQEVSFHQSGCDGVVTKDQPELYFTGSIFTTSAAFLYAMDPVNKINAGTQPTTYITFYSGWPTNLEVRYNPDTDRNELVDYPTFAHIKSGDKYVVGDKYSYMTREYEDAARVAVDKYLTSDPSITDYEKEIINAALNIELPEGIESIKEGLFTENEKDDDIGKTLTAYGLKEISGKAERDEDGNITATNGTFKDCKNLTAVYLMGDTASIGDYAFENCSKLQEVYIPATVNSLGLRPFKGCGAGLDDVNFQGSPYYTCENSIIYQLDSSGNKQKIVEFLEGRETGVVDASELVGVTEIAEEAFMDTKVSSVDLRKSYVEDIPERAFAGTKSLFSVYLPDTCKSISADSFKDSAIQYMEVPGSVSYIDNDAFSGDTNKSGLTFYCEDGSNAYLYAIKNDIKTTSKPIEISYTVTFWDWDSTLLDTQTVAAGMDAVPPEVQGREGYIHTGWVPDYHGVNSNLQVTAQYEAEDPDARKFKVTFLDWDDTELKTVLVLPGQDAEPPFDPKREGYTFTGWRPAVTNIQADTTIYAQYEKNDSSDTQLTVRFIDYDDTVLYTQKVNYGEDAILPQSPVREGYTFTGWRPAVTSVTKDLDTYAQYEKKGDNPEDPDNPNDPDNPDNPNNPNEPNNPDNPNKPDDNKPTSKLYTLTVKNGSGSGSYVAGSQPIIIANDPAANQEFAGWTIDPADTKIASKAITATVITMPEHEVTVTANYKAKSGSTGGSSGSTGSSNSGSDSNRPNNPSKPGNSGGTTVVIDKNGLSNTGVVSATVHGSSDNFTIKITESSAATEAVLKALMAEYGNDISNIKYFPMDISLYDAKGEKKITDATGLSVSITLPLPDSLITYAGNNKVASVVDDRLDKLSAKFTTISGVSCVTFTAEHFSPYVIYVDTDNLTAGVITDNTPKTGDGIHPKWFLSIGLACIAMVLFMKRDKRVVRARA